MIRVLLIDDHEMVRMGLAAFLEAQPDIEVIGEASDGSEGVRLAVELSPDVILMDLVMEGMDGIEATKQICRSFPTRKLLCSLASLMMTKCTRLLKLARSAIC